MSYESPEYLVIVRKVKAIPLRNAEKKDVCYLTRDKMDSLLDACETATPEGRRDYLMLFLLYNFWMRVSELISIQGKDAIVTGNGLCHLRIMGKGRKKGTNCAFMADDHKMSCWLHARERNSKRRLSAIRQKC